MNCLKRDSGFIFKSIAALLLLISLSSSGIVGSAKHVHYYRSRIHHRIRVHHHDGAIRLKQTHHRSRQASNHRIQKICGEIDKQTISDINKDRRHSHLPKFRINRRLSQIGNERSHQIQKYFAHNVKYHKNEVRYLLNKKKVHYKYYGENIASSPIGIINMLDVGAYNTPKDASQHYITYHARNGYQLANNINNASMYHDRGDGNGHRDNDLNRHFRQMGVGVSYNHTDKNFYITIEFIG